MRLRIHGDHRAFRVQARTWLRWRTLYETDNVHEAMVAMWGIRKTDGGLPEKVEAITYEQLKGRTP